MWLWNINSTASNKEPMITFITLKSLVNTISFLYLWLTHYKQMPILKHNSRISAVTLHADKKVRCSLAMIHQMNEK